MINRDVVIIGGGSTGLSIGYFLSRLGVKDITILEKSYVGSGSTGRCGTGIRAQFGDEPTIRLMKRSEQLWNELGNELSFNFRQTGYLYLHYSEEELRQYKEMKELQNSLGVPTKLLSPEEAKDRCELIDISNVKGASFNPEDGKAHPFDVVTGFKEYFQKDELELQERTPVTGIQLKNDGKLKIINTPEESYKTEILVNAAGGWAPKIGDLMGIEIPVEPYKHQAIITEPFEEGSIEPVVISMKHENAYLTQTERGGIIGGIGTREDETSTYDMRETLEFEERISRAFGTMIPSLKYARILKHWAGYYAMSPDGNPLLGEYKVPGHYLAAGFSGHGYMMAPSVGEALAEVVSGGKTDLPLDYYDPERIDRGELREAALQMG
ncbi:FAD-binding oxidoreductase [Candidatus Bipolaricaulota bacterium]|nr:FAD-binding oxidoreductase [Candidatus Bipolaricaulota bacterium]MBS3814579.1 FAD-binding oxidoreductase [Candidatus Bipolaricaulota bacterium]MBS3825684.1 FAD-binding oxidoreductase [Candidatus Bipolaricaulota bacterium]